MHPEWPIYQLGCLRAGVAESGARHLHLHCPDQSKPQNTCKFLGPFQPCSRWNFTVYLEIVLDTRFEMSLIRQGQEQQIVLSVNNHADKSLAVWYCPDPAATSPLQIAQQAYHRALKFHKQEFAACDTTPWLIQGTSVHHVLDILAKTQQRYFDKKRGRWKATESTITRWKALSSRMMQYDRVIDTFVSSNPEYAALVWGSMRFLFAATINHEELSTKIAQAFTEIGDVLPEAEFISQNLYPTERIQLTLANVYAQIIEFCIRATRWYDKTRRSTVKKVFSAVVKPWPLEFQDIKMKIDSQFKRLREQSAVAHQAETREIHVKLSEIRQFLNQGCPVSQAFGRLLTLTEDVT